MGGNRRHCPHRYRREGARTAFTRLRSVDRPRTPMLAALALNASLHTEKKSCVQVVSARTNWRHNSARLTVQGHAHMAQSAVLYMIRSRQLYHQWNHLLHQKFCLHQEEQFHQLHSKTRLTLARRMPSLPSQPMIGLPWMTALGLPYLLVRVRKLPQRKMSTPTYRQLSMALPQGRDYQCSLSFAPTRCVFFSKLSPGDMTPDLPFDYKNAYYPVADS